MLQNINSGSSIYFSPDVSENMSNLVGWRRRNYTLFLNIDF
jgi:hypothetical protein